MTTSIMAALVVAAVVGMSFNTTRWLGLSSLVILTYLKPLIVAPLVIILLAVYLYFKK